MATNGRDGMTPNTSFSDNSSSRKEEGIFGYLKNRNTKSDFSRDYWREGSGYLDSSIKSLKEMQKQYKELEKLQGKMTESQEREFKSKKRELEIQLSMLEDIKSNQEVSDKEAIKSIREANRIRQKGLESADKIMDQIADKQERLKKRR